MTTHLLACLLLSAPVICLAQDDDTRWYRGNTHTHTLWSDGDAPPEHAVKWYVDNDYDFLVLSDHNVMQEGERWFAITADGRLTPAKTEALEADFGADWVETRTTEEATEMRLRTLA
ncbi:MAG TPA: histidinol-phosphatase, partial [Phycisphaerales bacterium]|nr:histidinol-phosphatase [Phycisphaerales bacterium]